MSQKDEKIMGCTIGFLGLGAMGRLMVQRLLDAGHVVTVYNRTPDRSNALARAGATVAATPREAAASADFVFSMVRDDAASRFVWLDPACGALGGLRPHALAIESSTVSLEHVEQLAREAKDREREFLEAPVVGSRPQAAAGKLIHLVGGLETSFRRVAPILSAMSQKALHVGPTSHGMALKLAVNALLGIQVGAWAELLYFLQHAGLNESKSCELLAGFLVSSPAAAACGHLMCERKFEPQFPVELIEKDLGLLSSALRRESPLVDRARKVFETAAAAGLGDENLVAVRKLYGDEWGLR